MRMSLIGLPTMTLPEPATVDLAKVYDVLIVGSGAAGGMAAHALTSHGLDVLLLEAGRQVDVEAEVRSLEWPYDHPRRGKLPPDTYVLNEVDYKRLKPPYAQTLGRYTNVVSCWCLPSSQRIGA
jgi:choline dehydrogenase-like flavoprotein